jgi:uncharacterized membrane protein
VLSLIAEWANFLVRWIHLIAGISWIGNSFYFMWMDSSFEPLETQKPGVDGELYMVHGGHFYHVEKRKFRPGFIPNTLHWFKWEATFTWLSGFVLMILLYYCTNGIYLIGPESPIQNPQLAVLASLSFLFGTWFVYDAFWNTRFAEKQKNAATAISLAGVIFLCWALCRVFTGRGAYLHLGAVFATCMVLNVWFRILPRQQTMFDEAKAGKTPDYSAGPKAKQRSTHNSYMTLPVLFAMLSNHFALAYGHSAAWILLFLLCVLGATTRHMMLQWNVGKTGAQLLVPIGATAALMVFLSRAPEAATSQASKPSFTKVQAIVGQRCLPCHSQHPSDPTFPVPPNGVTFETADNLQKFAPKIKQRVFIDKTMPLVNRTQITDDERALLAAWVDGGADTHD